VGHLREAGAERPDRFMRELQLDGALTAEQRTRLLEIADRCPVHLTLERGARVATREVPVDAALPAVEPAGQHVQDMAEETGAPAEGGARAAG
jgi:putative redox protein